MSERTSNSPRLSHPTIRDVAALAGTSLKTVSRVVNGEPGVSPELGERVRVAIERLDYRRNLAASNLRRSGGRTRSIGLLLSNMINPLDGAIQRAIEETAMDRDVVVISSSIDEDAERERAMVGIFTARRVDGLIIKAAGHDQSYLSDLRRMTMAMVFVDRPPAFLNADTVVVDNESGTARGIAHLVANGHRRIGYLGALHTIVTAEQRVAGYRTALATARIEADESLIRMDIQNSEHAEAVARELLQGENPPTALFAAQNMITIGVVRALRQLDMHRSIAVIGFDDVPLFDLLEPAVTVLAQDAWAIGRQAAMALFDRLDGSNAPMRTHVIPVSFVQRGSGEIRGPYSG
ncbi:MAG: LacI family DNA-binding transcriptional regulator [Ilumatobacteraceae bacterium]|nr:LacI family DNA-binding transcriptional regulator [Ilumatobacteraceae bacterium]